MGITLFVLGKQQFFGMGAHFIAAGILAISLAPIFFIVFRRSYRGPKVLPVAGRYTPLQVIEGMFLGALSGAMIGAIITVLVMATGFFVEKCLDKNYVLYSQEDLVGTFKGGAFLGVVVGVAVGIIVGGVERFRFPRRK